ncbi:hypothetical protein [Maritalea mediterranea]|uniref:Uncharacterized protein n=1 Tax=Maritalea mediterranea TaxID=2909667 RepID=A0ABS9E5R8_9HYPH|nr:hypothetical protein [Maritalea mediterranea]MCF4098202.1 hypothetical protein [Maritalea mediterranea]
MNFWRYVHPMGMVVSGLWRLHQQPRLLTPTREKNFLMANAILNNSAFPLPLETVLQSFEQDIEYTPEFSKMTSADIVRYVLTLDAVIDSECARLLRLVVDRLEGGAA